MATSRAVVHAPDITGSAADYEKEHVHAVYDEIASHFSATRYKPWPIVEQFMSSLSPGSVGIDLGCGNGKYLGLPPQNASIIRTIGLDRSINLLQIAKNAARDGSDVLLGDVMNMPWRTRVFDYVISIATIHHLATHPRRVKSVEIALLSASSNGGRILIYVWAAEQDNASKRSIPSSANNSSSEQPSQPMGVDVLVPWVYNGGLQSQSSTSDGKPPVYKRYYHMFADGELRQLVEEAAQNLDMVIGATDAYTDRRPLRGITVVQEGWEKSNHYIELRLWEHS
ncbi:tRNA methyltransferase, has a role in tRNA modification [Serendipita sp. 399]|nr:tRNA methyltransferase, has a role in tRNA modification [Serendipita sp. 399]